MIDIAAELFAENDLTVACIVPLYWNDLEAWGDEELLEETATVRGIFETPYLDLQLGIAGHESSAPMVKILTAEIPGATAGDSITVDGTAYTVGTPKPDGKGITEIALTEE